MILRFIYNLGIILVEFGLKVMALFNTKIKLGVQGRAETFLKLQTHLNPNLKTLWFHCASLGEYEQGLPVFSKLRAHYKDYNIVLSFFSPSGYEIRKHSPIANIVVYLPIDTVYNAKKFIAAINPELSVFVKYDIWPNVLNVLHKKGHRALLISAVFRENQLYFKWYGKNFKTALFSFQHIFTQNESSKNLLIKNGYNAVSVSGDTRFDRVFNQLKTDNTLDFISEFIQQNICVVAGSTWPEDDALLINFINNNTINHVKFIIAPHNIKPNQIKHLQEKLQVKSVLYTHKDTANIGEASVFIVNTIGLLSKIYNYAHIAYVGGAYGNTGLHNVLEPAVFGVPIIIGQHFEKFPEAKALINHKGLFSIANQNEFNRLLESFIKHPEKRLEAGKQNSTYIKNHTGAVTKILNYLNIN